MALCTPVMGVNLWGEDPLYMNPVPSFYDGNESTSRRQAPSPSYGVSRGRHREVVSLSAMWDVAFLVRLEVFENAF